MIQIHPDQFSPGFSAMSQRSAPTGIRALAVLAGGNAGKILTDDPLHPHWGLVWEADDGTLYRGGNASRDVLCEAVTFLRQEGIVALGFRDGDPCLDLYPPDPQPPMYGSVCDSSSIFRWVLRVEYIGNEVVKSPANSG